MANTDALDAIDYVSWFQRFMSVHADMIPDSVTEEWIQNTATVAVQILVGECPNAIARYRRGRLKEATIGYVVSNMLARVAMWDLMKTENDGSYNYSEHDPVQSPPSITPSPDLFMKNSEKSLINGVGGGKGPVGTIAMGLGRMTEVPSL